MDFDKFLNGQDENDKKLEKKFSEFKKILPSNLYETFKKRDLQYSSETKEYAKILQKIITYPNNPETVNAKAVALLHLEFVDFKRNDNFRTTSTATILQLLLEMMPDDKDRKTIEWVTHYLDSITTSLD